MHVISYRIPLKFRSGALVAGHVKTVGMSLTCNFQVRLRAYPKLGVTCNLAQGRGYLQLDMGVQVKVKLEACIKLGVTCYLACCTGRGKVGVS